MTHADAIVLAIPLIRLLARPDAQLQAARTVTPFEFSGALEFGRFEPNRLFPFGVAIFVGEFLDFVSRPPKTRPDAQLQAARTVTPSISQSRNP